MGLEEFVFRVDSSWHTPASDYPLKCVGTAEIVRRTVRRNYYHMEGVGGYIYYQAMQPYKLTMLTINGQIVMTDEPINWVGMQKLAEHSYGRVLCGGLGLGLIVHALMHNSKVTEITVAEINDDVIKLMAPLMPKCKLLTIEHCDIYKFERAAVYDIIILDMWVGKGSRKILMEMLSALAHFKTLNEKNSVFIWGHGSQTINPAVDGEVRQKIQEY